MIVIHFTSTNSCPPQFPLFSNTQFRFPLYRGPLGSRVDKNRTLTKPGNRPLKATLFTLILEGLTTNKTELQTNKPHHCMFLRTKGNENIICVCDNISLILFA